MQKKTHKVLIIDDDPRYLDLLQFTLEAEKFEVQACSSSALAVKTAIDFCPDIILSDVSMPERDGFRLALDLRAESATSAIPVIFITARGQQSDKSEGRLVGAVDYLTKPFSPSELVAKIRQVLAAFPSVELKK